MSFPIFSRLTKNLGSLRWIVVVVVIVLVLMTSFYTVEPEGGRRRFAPRQIRSVRESPGFAIQVSFQYRAPDPCADPASTQGGVRISHRACGGRQ